jgi:hypothetical protein
MIPLGIRLDLKTLAAVEQLAADQKQSRGTVIRKLVEAQLVAIGKALA